MIGEAHLARNEKVVSIFLASPSDVADERAIVDKVVQWINTTLSRSSGLRFEIISWETHSRPGFGVDAQAVVNRQLPDDYDVFIGIMWHRFGTPTGRAGSGTEEEFNRAFDRFKRMDSTIEIMMYFKVSNPPLRDLIPAQLSSVTSFKTHVAASGGLYREFDTANDFEHGLRTHLLRVHQDWSRIQHVRHGSASVETDATVAVPSATVVDDAATYKVTPIAASRSLTAPYVVRATSLDRTPPHAVVLIKPKVMQLIGRYQDNLAWLSSNMSGLDTETCRILEVATVVTNNDLVTIAEGPVLVIHQPDSVLDAMDKWNKDTHGRSGLTDKVKASLIHEDDASAQMIDFLRHHVPKGSSPLCGNVVHHDRRFLARYMPKLEAYFHFRNLDVNTLEAIATRWNPAAKPNFRQRSGLPALAKIYGVIDDLKHYRNCLVKV